jgi:hypothetical protein
MPIYHPSAQEGKASLFVKFHDNVLHPPAIKRGITQESIILVDCLMHCSLNYFALRRSTDPVCFGIKIFFCIVSAFLRLFGIFHAGGDLGKRGFLLPSDIIDTLIVSLYWNSEGLKNILTEFLIVNLVVNIFSFCGPAALRYFYGGSLYGAAGIKSSKSGTSTEANDILTKTDLKQSSSTVLAQLSKDGEQFNVMKSPRNTAEKATTKSSQWRKARTAMYILASRQNFVSLEGCIKSKPPSAGDDATGLGITWIEGHLSDDSNTSTEGTSEGVFKEIPKSEFSSTDVIKVEWPEIVIKVWDYLVYTLFTSAVLVSYVYFCDLGYHCMEMAVFLSLLRLILPVMHYFSNVEKQNRALQLCLSFCNLTLSEPPLFVMLCVILIRFARADNTYTNAFVNYFCELAQMIPAITYSVLCLSWWIICHFLEKYGGGQLDAAMVTIDNVLPLHNTPTLPYTSKQR